MNKYVLTSGFLLCSMTALANAPQGPDLGSEQTYTIDGMKEKCKLFQSSAQLKPFSIRVECSKTENRWDTVTHQRPLPQWVEFAASGTGKGHIKEEQDKQDLAPGSHDCVVLQEKTVLSKGYIEATCDEFIQGVSDLVTLCRDGLVKKDGSTVQVNWQQVGDAEMGTQYIDSCATEIKDVSPGQQNQGQHD